MPKNNWEKEFDKEFPIKLFLKYDAKFGVNFERDIKSFIKKERTQLIQEFKEIVGENEKVDREHCQSCYEVRRGDIKAIGCSLCGEKEGINQAKQEIRDKLKELKEK